MEEIIEIHYDWQRDEGIEIPEKHKEILKEDAIKRIFEMIKEDYYHGELFTVVRLGKNVVPEEDEDDGLSYSGWWDVTIK